MIKTILKNTLKKIDLNKYESKVKNIHNMIHNKTGAGNEFLGWTDWPTNYDKSEYAKMKTISTEIKGMVKDIVVIGIGGSYLGSRAAIEMVNGLHAEETHNIYYAGHTLSSTYTYQLLKKLENKKFAIVVISKSGTTTEPAIAFRLFKDLLSKNLGKDKVNLNKYIVAITDKSKGALKKQAVENNYQTFTINDDIGGRYSVLTPVGIFIMMLANINTDLVLEGAQLAMKDTNNDDVMKNEAYKYAVARDSLLKDYNFKSEMFVAYEIQMQLIAEWWKQLFGESEGKNGQGLLPTSAIFSTDLHSLGQFIQDGTKNVVFETIVKIKKTPHDLSIAKDELDLEGLNYLTKFSLHEINNVALEGVLEAHTKDGLVPNIVLEMDTMDSKMFGYLSYWFMKSCAMSSYLLEINPFNQPGVEVYKQRMFKLLGKK